MKFQQIRGATVKISYNQKTFLIDPFFAPKDTYPPLKECRHPDLRWPTVNLPLTPEEIVAGTDALIITHLHPDHLDEYALKALPHDLPVFAQDGIDADALKNFGFQHVHVLRDDGISFDRITLYRVEGLHGHPETTQKYYNEMHMRAEACGIVFKAEGEPVFYLAGDTIWYEKVEQALKNFTPAVVALNAADARFTDSGSIIMGLEDILKVCQTAPEAKIIITHLDAVPHAVIGRADVREYIKTHRLQNQVLIPQDGEIINF